MLSTQAEGCRLRMLARILLPGPYRLSLCPQQESMELARMVAVRRDGELRFPYLSERSLERRSSTLLLADEREYHESGRHAVQYCL